MRVSEDTISCDDPDEVLVPNLQGKIQDVGH